MTGGEREDDVVARDGGAGPGVHPSPCGNRRAGLSDQKVGDGFELRRKR